MPHRITVNGLCWGPEPSLAEDVSRLGRLGIRDAGFHCNKLEAFGWNHALTMLSDAPIRVSYLIHRSMAWSSDAPSDQAASLQRTVEAAAMLGASTVYGTTGPSTESSFGLNVAKFERATRQARRDADALGIRIAVETTHPRYAAIHFVHGLGDALTLARETGVSLTIDASSSGGDMLTRPVVDLLPHISIFHVNDNLGGTTAWGVPGDGHAPVHEALGMLMDASYAGVVDVKVRGHDDESDEQAVLRTLAFLDDPNHAPVGANLTNYPRTRRPTGAS